MSLERALRGGNGFLLTDGSVFPFRSGIRPRFVAAELFRPGDKFRAANQLGDCVSTTTVVPETALLRLRSTPRLMEQGSKTRYPALRSVLLHHHRTAQAEPCLAVLREISERCVWVLADYPFQLDAKLIVEFQSEEIRPRVARVALVIQVAQAWMIVCELGGPLNDAELQALCQSDWLLSSPQNEQAVVRRDSAAQSVRLPRHGFSPFLVASRIGVR